MRSSWFFWAALLRRVFATDPWPWSLANPANCGRRMKLRAEMVLSPATPAPATHRILAGLAAASGTPP